MKKKFLLLMVLLLCIGCTRINNNNYDVIVNDVIENSNNIYNTNSLGYKYYLPFSINKVYDKDYNQKFKTDNVYIYLYVDVVSYYYHNNLNFNEELPAFTDNTFIRPPIFHIFLLHSYLLKNPQIFHFHHNQQLYNVRLLKKLHGKQLQYFCLDSCFLILLKIVCFFQVRL